MKTNFSKNDSYLVLTDGTRIEFDASNTPIENFSNYGDEATPITINGQNIDRNTVQEIVFGDSYNDLHFIGDFFLEDCTSLTSVDLSGLRELAWIGECFLRGCTALSTLIMGAAEPPRFGGDAFAECNFLPEFHGVQ